MLIQRIIGAFTFRMGVYAEVKDDTSFTPTAWFLVAVVAFLNQLGAQALTRSDVWLKAAVVITFEIVIGSALAALAIFLASRFMFKVDRASFLL